MADGVAAGLSGRSRLLHEVEHGLDERHAAYMRRDPVHRRFHHELLTFGQVYAYTENFVLPLSHDEVVHGKGSLLGKMPGDGWQKFANLRLLALYQLTSPGKKLNFMGNEFGQGREWQVQWELEWGQSSIPIHAGVKQFVRDLNVLYRDCPALHELDFSQEGFSWIDCHDADQSVVSFQRRARDGSFVVVVLNFTPVPRQATGSVSPQAAPTTRRSTATRSIYGGSNLGNAGHIESSGVSWMGLGRFAGDRPSTAGGTGAAPRPGLSEPPLKSPVTPRSRRGVSARHSFSPCGSSLPRTSLRPPAAAARWHRGRRPDIR